MLKRLVAVRLQEGGLVAVIVVLGLLLAVFGGSVEVPVYRVGADGTRTRAMRIDEHGQRVPLSDTRNKFLRLDNLAQLVKDASFIAIMAVGMTFVIVTGGIDLSIGATYALAAVVGGLTMRWLGADGGWPAVAAGAGACLATAAVAGLLNGLMTVGLQVHPFIITLGTMTIWRGVAFVATRGQSIGGFPPGLRALVRWEVGGLSLGPIAVTVAVGALGSLVLGRHVFGRHLYAVGGNEVASRYSGLPVGALRVAVFAIAGLSAGVAALVALGYYGSASSGDGSGYELSVIAAAVVGGASLSGGRGTALGAVLGAVVIQMIATGIVFVGIDQNYSQIIIGSVVILAVVLDRLTRWLGSRGAG